MKITTFESLLQASQSDVDKAMARHAIIVDAVNQLPRNAPAPTAVHDFGYCANVSLNFETTPELAKTIQDAYPAEELVLVDGGTFTVKPVSYLREQDASSHQLPVGPYVVKSTKPASDSEVAWWTRLSGGLMAQVTLRKAGTAVFDETIRTPRYEVDARSYSTGSQVFGVRALKPFPTKGGPLMEWHEAWEAFALAEQFTAAQLRVLRHVRARLQNSVETGTAWLADGIPPKTPPPLAGKALVIPEGRELPEYLAQVMAEARAQPAHDHWLNRDVQFWRHFDAPTADVFWSFCLRMAASLDDARTNDASFAQEAAAELTKLMEPGIPLVNDSKTWKHLLYALRHRLGRYVDVRVRRVHNKNVDVEVLTCRLPAYASYNLTAQGNSTRRLLPQDIPNLYVD